MKLTTRLPQTDEAIEKQAARNARRLAVIKRSLGERHVTHPANHVKRLAEPGFVTISADREHLAPIIRHGHGAAI